ncbi:MAG: MBL fold metallo-hydrolase [Eubacteriales bacterium]|nr:MBL fold metallo-hydrolase [Eubacteriales bacterium]MDD4134495.1 MBL fold metallo-hydrolase [Eubacteriales bacterium]
MFIWELKAPVAKPTITMDSHAFDKIGETKIYWLGAAGFLVNARGTNIFIDPVIEYKNASTDISEVDIPLKIALPIEAHNVPVADLVVYTHSDDDHLAEESAKALERLNAKFFGPPPVFEKLARLGLNLKNVTSCRSGDIIEVPNAKITVFPADHPWQLQDPEKYGKPFRAGDSVGYIIETPDANLFFPGDTRLMEEHLSLKGFDFLALDVSLCTYHINPKGAATLANILKDAHLMPYHYGTFDAPTVPAHCGDPYDVIEMVDNGAERAHVTAPGEPICFKNHKLIADT